MNLQPFTYNGGTLNNGTTLIAKIMTEGQLSPSSNILEVTRTNNFPVYAGKEIESKLIPVVINMPNGSGTLVDYVNGILDTTDTSEHQLICKDTLGSNKQWYVDAVVERQTEFGPNVAEYSVYTADPVWKSVTPGTVTWGGTASPGTITATPAGNKYALPVFSITPTVARGTSFTYKRFITAYNPSNVDYGNYQVNFTDNGSGTAYMSGAALVAGTKLQSDGDDLRIYSDGKEIYRWFGGTVNSATTLVWGNIKLPPNSELTVKDAIAPGDTVTSIEFNDTNANRKALTAIPRRGILKSSAGELFVYTSLKITQDTVFGVTRAAKGSTAGTVTAGGTLTYIPHDIWMMYGAPELTAPEQDEDERFNNITYNKEPIIDLTTSNNRVWDYNDFYDRGNNRSGTWKPKKLLAKGVTSGWYGGNRGTVGTNPASELGLTIQSYQEWLRWYPDNAFIAWDLYQPARFGTVVYSGEKYHGTINSWPNITGWSYGNTFNPQQWPTTNIASPSSFGSWQSFSGTITPSTSSAYWRLTMRGSVLGRRLNASYLECSDVTGYIPPANAAYVSMGAEQDAYQINLTIKSNRTAEWIKISGPMKLNETITVDCKNKTVTLNDGTNAINYLDLSSSRDEWLTLTPGVSNPIVFTETGLAGQTIVMTYEDRSL